MITQVYYEQPDIEEPNRPLSRKAEIIKNVITVIVVGIVTVSLLSLGIFYSLDVFDIYQPNEEFSFHIRTANILTTLSEFETIAKEHSNSRAIDLGYNASAEYVLSKLDPSYFQISVQDFPVIVVENTQTPEFSILSPSQLTLVEGVDFETINYSGSGSFIQYVVYVGTGCTNESYLNFPAGYVALSTRSSDCRTSFKCQLAQDNAASALLIYNDQPGLFSSSAGNPFNIPLLALSNEIGNAILNLRSIGDVNVSINVQTEQKTIYTSNIIAETKTGLSTSVIVSGTHLDSVPAGPGINDNGSGSAANLEIANEMAVFNIVPENKVRFAWWGAEELGLKGSRYYVSSLTPDEISNIVLNLNFDMIGSPNFLRGVYNGTQAEPSIRTQCETITSLFTSFFNSQNLSWSLSDFSGRSDYAPFLEVGIPAGGLDTGMEELKTIEERSKFGGIANTPFDPCYHQACDTVQNINRQALGEMSRAAAQVLYDLAMQKDLSDFLANPTF